MRECILSESSIRYIWGGLKKKVKKMEEEYLEALLSLERQAFVHYTAVVDKNGFPISLSGNATKTTAAYVREVHNCAKEIFPGQDNIRIVVEGTKNAVTIGEQNDVLVGVQVVKDMY